MSPVAKGGCRKGCQCATNMGFTPKHLRRGVEQWQLVGLITRRSLVRVQPPLPIATKKASVLEMEPRPFYFDSATLTATQQESVAK